MIKVIAEQFCCYIRKDGTDTAHWGVKLTSTTSSVTWYFQVPIPADLQSAIERTFEEGEVYSVKRWVRAKDWHTMFYTAPCIGPEVRDIIRELSIISVGKRHHEDA